MLAQLHAGGSINAKCDKILELFRLRALWHRLKAQYEEFGREDDGQAVASTATSKRVVHTVRSPTAQQDE